MAPLASFRITFGLGDTAPRAWDGEVLPEAGQTLVIEADRLRNHDYAQMTFSAAGITMRARGETELPNDHVRGALAWVASTREASLHGPTTEWHVRPGTPDPVIQSPSVLVHLLKGSLEAPIQVRTVAGSFTVSPPALAPFGSAVFLDGAVRVDRVPAVSAADPAVAGQQDYPSLLVTGADERWVAWQEYDDASEADCVKVRRWSDGSWQAVEVLIDRADVFHTALARPRRRRVGAIWSMQHEGRWNLYGRAWDGGTWSPLRRLTRHPGADVFHRVATDSAGRLWLVWQRTVNGTSQIFAKSFDGRRWSQERQISEGAAAAGNSWWPAIAAGPGGSVAIAWDGYAAGRYDVYVRRMTAGRWGGVLTAAGSPRFEAHPTVAIDGQRRVWVAWDESGADWGKDTGFAIQRPATQLHEWRRVGVACLEGDAWLATAGDLDDVQAAGANWELPQIEIDGAGTPVLFVRHLVKRQPDTPLEAPIDLALWEIHVTRYEGSRWTPPVYVPRSSGRNEMLPATSVATDGTVWAAWATDVRDTRSYLPHQHLVQMATLGGGSGPAARPVLVPRVGQSPAEPTGPVEPAAEEASSGSPEREHVARIRAYRITTGGRTFAIYRGDLHRHTDVSVDGGNDGSLLDAYRYARDAAAMDFLGVSDHTDGVDDLYAWWRTQKIADVFQDPGSFVAFYGYERSVEFPNGHRNVFFARRGARVTPISAGESMGWEGAESLYAYLRRRDGFAIPHTTGRTSGTDWRDNDRHVEPLVEIYQGMRDSYEEPSAPRPYRVGAAAVEDAGHPAAPVPRASSAEASSSFRRAGFVSAALAKGHRLGFIASSDHISAHISYACLIAETLTPEGLLEAVRARRAYAATDNIVLDVRFRGSDGEHLMGAEFETSTPVTVAVRVLGTGPIRHVDVIRDNTVVHSVRPDADEAAFSFADVEPAAAGAERCWYVRVVQEDGAMAWGSPAWARFSDAENEPNR